MAHSIIEMTSINDQISLIPQTEKDEIEEGRKGDHLIDIEDTNDQDPSRSQTKKSLNQIFDEKFKHLDNLSVKSCTIFKVNVWLSESNPVAYTPKLISIGPYHKKNPQLGRMETYKLLYLRRFLHRKKGLDVESCINELLELKEKAIKCYEDIQDDSQFYQMLLLDGCFVVEFIRECCRMCPEGEDIIINNYDRTYIFRDLILLENQLPFFILDKLHDMTKRDAESPLSILAGFSLPLFVDLPSETRRTLIETCTRCYNIKHLLHLVHILLCHGNRKEKSENKDNSMGDMFMPNATELSEAGVRFAKVSNINSNKDNFTSLFNIKFENGLMTIPCFKVEDDMETLLRNLIAYEQQSCDVYPKYFSDYSFFMDNLIDSDKDVNLLRQEGIIENWIGENKQVASLFNKIGSGVTMSPNFYYKQEFRKAVEHCKRPCNKLLANLLHNYFSTPWVGASTVAAIILLILTTIQTILAFTGPVK